MTHNGLPGGLWPTTNTFFFGGNFFFITLIRFFTVVSSICMLLQPITLVPVGFVKLFTNLQPDGSPADANTTAVLTGSSTAFLQASAASVPAVTITLMFGIAASCPANASYFE